VRTADDSLRFLQRLLASEIDPSSDCRIESDLELQRTRLRWMFGNLTVEGNLILASCQRFRGFKGESLYVDGDLVIGGKSSEFPWLGQPGIPVQKFGRRVTEFLKSPSVESSCPFSNWPQEVEVTGKLVLINCKQCVQLPEKFVVGRSIELINCGIETLPDSLEVKDDLIIDGCPIEELPANLKVVGDLHLRNLSIATIPLDLSVGKSLHISRCKNLKTIPHQIHVGDSLNVTGCGVEAVDDEFSVKNRIMLRNCPIKEFPLRRFKCEQLVFHGCNQLQKISRTGAGEIRLNVLVVNQCESFNSLPEELRALRCQLTDLPMLKALPRLFRCNRAIEISGTTIEKIEDAQLSSLSFRVRNVPIPAYALFEPHRIQVEEVLEMRNAEVRRMMLEQMGIDKFEQKAKRFTIDEDVDPGGKRSLIRFSPSAQRRWGVANHRVFLMCRCPSTGRVYLLQVPPTVSSCHAAAAWLAGFDDPDDYKPMIET